MKSHVEPNHYFNTDYDSKERFCSYWHQIQEIMSLAPERVLEIGIGNGFVAKYLRDRKRNVVTLDIDERLNPDVVGSVVEIPFDDNSFDVVTCCEVLEHLPYENFHKALSEIRRVSSQHTVLSLPDCTRAYRVDIQIPKIGELKRLIRLPMLKPLKHVSNEEHYWEIGKTGYPLRRVIADIRKAGFEIERTYRVFEFVYHRFFILQKRMG